MTRSQSRSTSPLIGLASLVETRNARAPQADVSNAAYLMGDVYMGDVDDDEDFIGDAAYGDVSTAALDTYETLIGEPYGAPKVRRKKPILGPKGKKIATHAAAAAGGAGVALLTSALIAKAKRKKRLREMEQRNAAMETISHQVEARQMLGKIPLNTLFPFFQATGATLNSYPLAPTERFPVNDLKLNMDRQSTDTPFEVDIQNGTFAGVTWTVTFTGVATARYYVAVFLTIGISTLTANPGTIFSVTGTFPLFNGGTLSIAANPLSFTLNQGWYAKIVIFPWQLVTNKPLLQLGSYNNANPITINVVGLPSNATVNGIVPGSQHVWSIGMRNRLV